MRQNRVLLVALTHSAHHWRRRAPLDDSRGFCRGARCENFVPEFDSHHWRLSPRHGQPVRSGKLPVAPLDLIASQVTITGPASRTHTNWFCPIVGRDVVRSMRGRRKNNGTGPEEEVQFKNVGHLRHLKRLSRFSRKRTEPCIPGQRIPTPKSARILSTLGVFPSHQECG